MAAKEASFDVVSEGQYGGSQKRNSNCLEKN